MVISSMDGMLLFYKRLSIPATTTLVSLRNARSSNFSPRPPSLIVSSRRALMSPPLDGLINFPAATLCRRVPERLSRVPAVVLPLLLGPPRLIPPMSQAGDGVTLAVLRMSRALHFFFPNHAVLHTNSSEIDSDDLAARTFPIRTADNAMTVEKCVDYCVSQGNAYAGTQFANECYCGNTAPPAARMGAKCDTPCAGNANEVCGGALRLSVYKKNGAKKIRRDVRHHA